MNWILAQCDHDYWNSNATARRVSDTCVNGKGGGTITPAHVIIIHLISGAGGRAQQHNRTERMMMQCHRDCHARASVRPADRSAEPSGRWPRPTYSPGGTSGAEITRLLASTHHPQNSTGPPARHLVQRQRRLLSMLAQQIIILQDVQTTAIDRLPPSLLPSFNANTSVAFWCRLTIQRHSWQQHCGKTD